MRAMILAAGRGERMRPLTDNVPKPLLAVGGKPLIEYHIEALARGGVREIVINLAWKGAQIREALGDGARFGVHLEYSDEGEVALETGGGIHRALPLLGPDAFVIVSGDIWTDYDLTAQVPRLAAADVAHFVLVPNPSFHPRGDFGLEHGRCTDAPPRWTYANIAVLRPAFFAACEGGRFPLAPLMFGWIRAGRVSGEIHGGAWFNIGTPQQLGELDRRLTLQKAAHPIK